MKKVALNFVKGILAGLAIGLGGFIFVLMKFAFPNHAEVGKLLGSVLFAVGLFLVCTFSLSLYTGKIGLVYEEKKDKWFYISLPVMLIGNAIGAFAFGYICFAIFRNTDLYTTAVSVASSRIDYTGFMSYVSCAVASFLCGTCVYLAVKSFSLNRLKPIGILLLVFFVFVFVYAGFQHCIANMFYFGMANAFAIKSIDGAWWKTIVNLLIVIVFNSFGPLPAVLMWKLMKK